MGAENTAKTRKSRMRLNIIDFLIIIVLIGAVVGIAMRFGLVERVTNQAGMTGARISFLIRDINEGSLDYFGIGDTVYDKEHDCLLGTLESRQFMYSEAFITTERGEIIKTNSENKRYDVRGAVIGSGTFTDDGFLLDGVNYVAPGSTIHVQSRDLDVILTVTAVERVDTVSE